MQLLAFESGVLFLVYTALTLVKMWAMIDAIIRPAQAYLAADKLTKAGWLWILGLSLAAHLLFPRVVGLLSLAGTVAAFVYLLDVRPALAAVTRRR